MGHNGKLKIVPVFGFPILRPKSMDVVKSSSATQEPAASDRREYPYNYYSGYTRPNSGALDSFVRCLNKDVMQQMYSEAQCDDQDSNSAQNIQDSHMFAPLYRPSACCRSRSRTGSLASRSSVTSGAFAPALSSASTVAT